MPMSTSLLSESVCLLLLRSLFLGCFLLAALPIGVQSLEEEEWGYGAENGPTTWGGHCNSGSQQSPINIETAKVVKSTMEAIKFVNYGISGKVELENGGHDVRVGEFDAWANVPYISGGGLDGNYQVSNVHFHRSQDADGSEHALNGKKSVVEMHIVHIKEGLTIEEALEQPDGVAAIGVFYSVGTNGTAMSKLATVLDKLVDEGSTTTLDSFVLDPLVPSERAHFYRYNGSLTIPECNEAVIWSVMASPGSLLSSQLKLFRAINGRDGSPQPTNSRPLQAFNGREVLYR